MPVTKQAKKRMRSDAKKHALNQNVLSRIKTEKKKYATITDIAEAQKFALVLSSSADKAASKGSMPKNRANRIKARAAKRLAKLAATKK